MGHLSENAYRMAFYLFYRARKAPLNGENTFTVRIEDIIKYIGLPTKEEVKNRNYDEAIMRPFNKAVEEIENISGGSLQMSFEYDNINTFMAGQMTIGIDDTMTDYIQRLEKTKNTKQLEAKGRRRNKAESSSWSLPLLCTKQGLIVPSPVQPLYSDYTRANSLLPTNVHSVSLQQTVAVLMSIWQTRCAQSREKLSV